MAKKPSDQPKRENATKPHMKLAVRRNHQWIAPSTLSGEERDALIIATIKESMRNFGKDERKVLKHLYEDTPKGNNYANIKKIFIHESGGYAIDDSEIRCDDILCTLIDKGLAEYFYSAHMPLDWDGESATVGKEIRWYGLTTSPELYRKYGLTLDGRDLVLSWRGPIGEVEDDELERWTTAEDSEREQDSLG